MLRGARHQQRPGPLSSPRSSFYRCYVVHATNDLLVKDNVGFDVHGHCFYVQVRRTVPCMP